jgi:hypothetical protein
LAADQQALQNRTDELNATTERLRVGLTTLRENPNASVQATFDRVNDDTPVALNETDLGIYSDAATQLRNAPNQTAAQAAFELGTQGVLREEFAAVEQRGAELQQRGEQLRERGAALEERGEELEADAERLESLAAELETERAALENASDASLDEQRAKLESMNETEIDETLGVLLSDDGDGGSGAFAFLPSSYDPGSTEATATTIFVTQESDTESGAPGAASDELETAQLAMQDLVESRNDPGEYLVFGSGIISDETSASQEESFQIVGPLAGVFVLIALVIAYRDPVDIVLGLAGIVAVLLWTFGFMGWADIGFNQIMIAVPVLLIGLSIDYAIHIFMRHREEGVGDGDDRDRLPVESDEPRRPDPGLRGRLLGRDSRGVSRLRNPDSGAESRDRRTVGTVRRRPPDDGVRHRRRRVLVCVVRRVDGRTAGAGGRDRARVGDHRRRRDRRDAGGHQLQPGRLPGRATPRVDGRPAGGDPAERLQRETDAELRQRELRPRGRTGADPR